MQRSLAASTFAIALFSSAVALTGVAWACGAGAIVYEDAMVGNDESWGWPDDPNKSVGADGTSWNLQPGVNWSILNQTSLYTDAELCVKIASTSPDGAGGGLGLTFWANDSSNNYSVDLYPRSGLIAVFRTQNGKYLRPVPSFTSDAVKKEPGAINELSVAFSGNKVVVTVNGAKVKEFKGIPPNGGGLVGLDFSTPSADPGNTKVTYADYQVREYQPPAEAAKTP